MSTRILFDGYLMKRPVFARWIQIINKLLFDGYLIESDKKNKISTLEHGNNRIEKTD